MWRNGDMKFLIGENGRTLEENLPDSVLTVTKPTWSDSDANSGPERWEASV